MQHTKETFNTSTTTGRNNMSFSCIVHTPQTYIYVLRRKHSVHSLAQQVIQLWLCEHVGQVVTCAKYARNIFLILIPDCSTAAAAVANLPQLLHHGWHSNRNMAGSQYVRHTQYTDSEHTSLFTLHVLNTKT